MEVKSNLLFGIVTESTVGPEKYKEIRQKALKVDTVSRYYNDIFKAALVMARNSGYKLDEDHGLGDFLKTRIDRIDDFTQGMANLFGEVYLQHNEDPLLFVEDDETDEVLEVKLDDWINQLRKDGKLIE